MDYTFKGTKGPWLFGHITEDQNFSEDSGLKGSYSSLHILDERCRAIVQVMGTSDSSGWVDSSQVMPNAHLISAAPHLLEALKILISRCQENPSKPGNWWSKGTPTDDELDFAKQAIHKALNIQP